MRTRVLARRKRTRLSLQVWTAATCLRSRCRAHRAKVGQLVHTGIYGYAHHGLTVLFEPALPRRARREGPRVRQNERATRPSRTLPADVIARAQACKGSQYVKQRLDLAHFILLHRRCVQAQGGRAPRQWTSTTSVRRITSSKKGRKPKMVLEVCLYVRMFNAVLVTCELTQEGQECTYILDFGCLTRHADAVSPAIISSLPFSRPIALLLLRFRWARLHSHCDVR